MSYADDNTPYVEANNVDEVITTLKNDSVPLLKWFPDNKMKTNKNKCHLVIINNKEVSVKIDNRITGIRKHFIRKIVRHNN